MQSQTVGAQVTIVISKQLQKIMAQTADLPAASEIVISRESENDWRPKTAVGTMAALSVARLDIYELETRIVDLGGTIESPFKIDEALIMVRQLESARARVRELTELLASISSSQAVER